MSLGKEGAPAVATYLSVPILTTGSVAKLGKSLLTGTGRMAQLAKCLSDSPRT